MKLSIQRQCDGSYGHPTAPRCNKRLDVVTEVADRLAPREFQDAWKSIATAMGWRRHGEGEPVMARGDGELVTVPFTRTGWIMCPECVVASGMACVVCSEASCKCIEGPYFDVDPVTPTAKETP